MLPTVQRRLNNKKGFTLIELIVVIAIIGILAAILIPKFSGFTDAAKEKAAISDARNIMTSISTIMAKDPSKAISSVTKSEVQALSGAYTGTVRALSLGATNGLPTFTYDYVSNSKHFVVTVTDGVVGQTVSNSDTAATGTELT